MLLLLQLNVSVFLFCFFIVSPPPTAEENNEIWERFNRNINIMIQKHAQIKTANNKRHIFSASTASRIGVSSTLKS